MNAELLKIARKKAITFNPFSLAGDLRPTIDNGHGRQIEDYSAAPVPVAYINPVRIATKKRGIKKTIDGKDSYVFEDVYMMVSDVDTLVDVRLEFDYYNVRLKVTKRIPLKKYGVIIAYEYELDDITEETII